MKSVYFASVAWDQVDLPSFVRMGFFPDSIPAQSPVGEVLCLAGITNLTLTIANDSTFTINMRRSTLKGNITPITDKNSPNNFTLNFKMSGKINLGKIDANIAKAGSSTMSLTFDISKLMTIVEKVGAITGNSSVQGVSKLLNGYDGINAGFKLKK